MNSCPKRGRQPGIAGNHKDKTPRPADAGEIPAQSLASWLAIVAQHHGAQAGRQPRRRGSRVRQPARVGKQPDPRQAAPEVGPPASGPGPGEQARVHADASERRADRARPGHDDTANNW